MGGTPAALLTSWSGRKGKPFSACVTTLQAPDAGRSDPFIAFFGLFPVLGLTIALPRFIAGNGTACAVLGGEWLRGPKSRKEACVFYAG